MDLGIYITNLIYLFRLLEKNKLYFGKNANDPTCINIVGGDSHIISSKPKQNYGINQMTNSNTKKYIKSLCVILY